MPPSAQTIRAVLNEVLGDGRLAAVSDSDPLLNSGVISSIETISVIVRLESEFGIKLSDPGQLNNVLNSINSIRDWLSGDGSLGSDNPLLGSPLLRSLSRFLSRPFVALLVIALMLLTLDRGIGLALDSLFRDQYRSFLEQGQRLYPCSGAFSHDDLRAAFSQHELSTAPPAASHVVLLGDSGTFGSFLRADQTISFHLESHLREKGMKAQVFNLAFYIPSLPKDLSLLEMVLRQTHTRPKYVIFTLGDEYFDGPAAEASSRRFDHIYLHHGLFSSFLERIDGRETFEALIRPLIESDLAHKGELKRWDMEHRRLYQYKPFITYYAQDVLMGGMFGSKMNAELKVGARSRLTPTPPPGFLSKLDDSRYSYLTENLLKEAVKYLHSLGIQSVLYVKPHAPAEWKSVLPKSSVGVLDRLAHIPNSLLVDARYALQTTHFTDSTIHYTESGNKIIAELIAKRLLQDGR